MHKTIAESIRLVTELKGLLSGKRDTVTVVAPPFTALNSVSIALQNSHLKLAAQNVHQAAQGAYTGEISASMLLDAGCSYVILGHSERRLYFAETNDTVNKKLRLALDEGLAPIMCIGERQEERDAGRTEEVLTIQLTEGLKGLRVQNLAPLIVAYEPVWAIGTGKNATPELAQEAHATIRKHLGDMFGSVFANGLRILYGGSVNAENIPGYVDLPDLDGVLVGGASLNSESFAKIVTSFD